MMIFLRWLFNAFFLLLSPLIFRGVTMEGFYAALVAAFFLGIVNAIIRPLIILLTLPITIITLGLFSLVINGLMVMFVASFVKGFSVANFGSAIGLALFLWLGSVLTNFFLKAKQE